MFSTQGAISQLLSTSISVKKPKYNTYEFCILACMTLFMSFNLFVDKIKMEQNSKQMIEMEKNWETN